MTANAWRSFVPHHVVAELMHGTAEPLGRELRAEAVVLFADVAGFTTISEVLGRSGRHGTEELTQLLNAYFAPMIALIETYGGIIGKFGGDALTVLFFYAAATRSPVTRRAVSCALAMQRTTRTYAALQTSAGSFTLAMKAGLARGSVLCLNAGDPELRIEYLLAGRVLDQCAETEHYAGHGEVLVADELLTDLSDASVGRQVAGFSLIRALSNTAPPAPLAPLPQLTPLVERQIARFLHPSVAQRIAAGQLGFLNEHRPVTVLFVGFNGFAYDDNPQVGQQLRAYLAEVVRIIANYDGYLNKVDMGDKGSKYLVIFGAPVLHEDDEERALRCALELRLLPHCTVHIGINTGAVFCGQVGSSTRREYTVMGDPVNLAARLMQLARPHQIVVSASTQRAVATRFVWEALPLVRVKGKPEPQVVFSVQAASEQLPVVLHEPETNLPLVGRRGEQARIGAALATVANGQGQVLTLVGEAGLGKSRLVVETVRLAQTRGFVSCAGACQSYRSASAYLVWHSIWQRLFDLTPTGSLPNQIAQATAALQRRVPHLAQQLPLLGPVLKLAIADNAQTAELIDQVRLDSQRALLLAYLRAQAAADGPLLIVLEDCHWIDPLSRELLVFLGRNIATVPVCLLITTRPPDANEPLLHGLRHLPYVRELQLADLPADEARTFSMLKLTQRFGDIAQSHQHLAERLAERAQGNPYYIEELVNYLHDHGLSPQTDASLPEHELQLPTSLHSLVLSRIDQLSEDVKVTLRVASVIGRVFRAAWLWGSYPALGSPTQVRAQLELLSQVDLTLLEQPEPELVFLFKHSFTHEVAYESLSFALRDTLHAAVGAFIEHSFPDQLDDMVDLLAFHYGRSANQAKQRYYFRRAGAAAKAAFANATAIDYYQQSLALLTGAERGEVLHELGEVLQLTGAWDAAETAFREGLTLVTDQRAAALMRIALARLLTLTQHFAEALTLLEAARTSLTALAAWAELGQALEALSFALLEHGQLDQALGCAQERLHVATAHGDQAGLGAAHELLGTIAWVRGDHAPALEHLQQALASAATANHKLGAIIAGNDITGVYGAMGDYANALYHARQALATASAIGYQHAMGVLIATVGEIYRAQGALPEALICYEQSLVIVTTLGDDAAIRANLTNIATVYQAGGRYSEAETLLQRAIAIGSKLGMPDLVSQDRYRLARLYAHQGRYREALEVNREAQRLADELGTKEFSFLTTLLDRRLQVSLGELDPEAAVGSLLSLLPAWPAAAKRAEIQYTIWRVSPDCTAARLEAATLYQQLYEHTPDSQYRRRYATLTGEDLPQPPALPPPPILPGLAYGQLEPLLARVVG